MNWLISTFIVFTSVAGSAETGLPMTITEVVEQMKEHLTCDWSTETVDTFKAGDPGQEVTGIACTFMATVDVLKQAAELGCNLIVTHEPTYYNHLDQTDLLENDPVYAAKQAIIEEHKLVVFRFHDHWHRTSPDGIYVGMIDHMQWGDYLVPGEKNIFELPGMTVGAVTAHMRKVFPDADIRVIGDPDLVVGKAAFSAGAPGSANHIRLLQHEEINLIVVGEAPEWESLAYVNDASQAGLPKAMILLGHTVSEEAGMEYCATWMRGFIKDVPVRFIAAGDPFHP